MRVLASEHRHEPIRINALVLGTPIVSRIKPDGDTDWLTAEEVGQYVAWLVSSRSTTRGQIIRFNSRAQLTTCVDTEMAMIWLFLFVVFCLGRLIATQAGVNSQLVRVRRHPLLAATVSFLVGTVALAICSLGVGTWPDSPIGDRRAVVGVDRRPARRGLRRRRPPRSRRLSAPRRCSASPSPAR